MLWFGFRAADEALVGGRVDGDGLLSEPVEELAAALRLSAVEPEGELVEVVVEMFLADGALVGSQKPALKQGSNTVDTGHDDMGELAVGPDPCDFVDVAERFNSSVASPAVGLDDRPGFDTRLDKPLKVGSGSTGDPLHADTANAVTVFLGRHGNQRFSRCSTATNAAFPLRFITTYIGLINLDPSRETFPPRTNHCPAKFVQPRPCRLVASKTQDALETQSAHARLLTRHPPHRTEPSPKRLPGPLEDRPRCDGSLAMAGRTLHQIAAPDRPTPLPAA